MKTKRTAVVVLVACLFSFMAHDALAFYNPSTGRWLSRDPMEANLSSTTTTKVSPESKTSSYTSSRNNSVNGVDVLGLLEFKTQNCQGCNNSSFPEWLGYWHTPVETDPECKSRWETGANGFFSHRCGNWPLFSGLCNTDTYIKVRATNVKSCCRKWLIYCNWEYTGYLRAQRDLTLDVYVKFLGKTVYHFFDTAPKTGETPPYLVGQSKSGFEFAVKYVAPGQTIDVFGIYPFNSLHGRPNEISETGYVDCFAQCWSEE